MLSDRDPPLTDGRLFHYTTATGLLGILGSSVPPGDLALWATDLRFLNDEQELDYARDQLSLAVDALSNPAADPGHSLHHTEESFGKAFDTYKELILKDLESYGFPVYAACFCESGDLLSQWRAYGADHGYAIELAREPLEAAADGLPGDSRNHMLTQVHYGHEAAAAVMSIAQQHVVQDTNLGSPGVHAHLMAARLTALLAGVKHPAFRQEREWRLIAGFESPGWEEVKFRSTEVAIVPYIEVGFPRSAVLSIRVGPGRHTQLREQGVRRLLRSCQLDVPITISDIPLRA